MRDIDTLRAETPGCAHVSHLNNAGASLPPRAVTERVIAHLEREATIGGYEAAEEAAEEMAAAYESVAALIGADRAEIALTDSATRSWLGVFTAIRFRPGDRIVTTSPEYASNIIAMRAAARTAGVTITVVPSAADGAVDLAALADTLDDDVRVVAVTHAPTNGGLVQPLTEIGALVKPYPALLLVDACQSVGQVPIDVERDAVDALCATGRKYLRAPRGTGFLYVRRELIDGLEPVHLDLHSATVDGDDYIVRDDARRFELWESNVAANLGLGVAARYYAGLGPGAVWARISGLADTLRGMLAEVAGVTVTDLGTVRSGIVTFQVSTMEADKVVRALRQERINTTVSGAASTPYDMSSRGLAAVVRASVHYYNTEDELVRLRDAVHALTS